MRDRANAAVEFITNKKEGSLPLAKRTFQILDSDMLAQMDSDPEKSIKKLDKTLKTLYPLIDEIDNKKHKDWKPFAQRKD